MFSLSINNSAYSAFQQSLDFSMIMSQLLNYVAVLFFCVSRASSLDTFIAAVYEHAVILPNATLVPVSPEEALAVMNRNLDLLEGAVTSASKQVPFLKCASGSYVEKGWHPSLIEPLSGSITPLNDICLR